MATKEPKNRKAALAKVDRAKRHTVEEAVTAVKGAAYAKFDESVDIAVRLGGNAPAESYLRGDRGIFTRRAVRLLDNSEARDVAEVVLWYNKPLFEQAGVDPASMSSWDGFLAGVQKFKDAGITPLSPNFGAFQPA